MGRPRTSFDLQRLADIAKKREVAREAAKKAATPKPYKKRGATTKLCFESAEDENVWVEIAVLDATITFVTTAGMTALGAKTAAEVLALPGTPSIVDFKGNNQDVLRVRIHDPKATPVEKVTPWGTRVVDKIDKSYQVPMSIVAASNSLSDAKVQFRTLFGPGGVLAGKITEKENAYAELYHGKKLLATIR
ncbi:MAG: hypothetical protein JGK21_31345 [Microcoleus sp. PH2017_22_RUC_O_B]|uniref:hypothetical protein n=1 Tax=unclassified Microcoleus TaxID=2642155 RepID=UPI001D1F76C5|nr:MULTISPECIES: hypothetical protein [unclassified Microcoleus]MCC3532569.1 hypothetical protein [Microcoleus sp. PH2017_21_RUC_O_A]MCC3544736.1 hypothetical protein [Microcoleus sp. PH2017_22_RUC_O_B]